MGIKNSSIFKGDYIHNQHLPFILIMENDPNNLRLLLNEFRPHYNICVVSNTEEAMQKLNEQLNFDFIISKVMNYEGSLGGIYFYELLSQHISYSSIPFLFITDQEDVSFNASIIAKGIIDSFTEPINAPLIRSRIDGILNLLQKQRNSIMDWIYKNRHKTMPSVPVNQDKHKLLASQFGLTRKELEICQLISTGYLHKGIALSLGITVNTVKSHLQNASKKVGARGREQLAQRFRELMG